jgi:antitoxin YefM
MGAPEKPLSISLFALCTFAVFFSACSAISSAAGGEKSVDKIKITIIMVILNYGVITAGRFSMLTIQDYIPVTKAKSNLLDIIRKIEGSDDAIAITKNGVPEAVILSVSKFEGLMETIDILSDEKAMKSIRRSIKEARDGKWLDFDEVFAE